jgi:hypothetical protein
MLFNIEEDNASFKIGGRYIQKLASEIGIREKNIENWIADNPQLIFPNEDILTIGQSISGRSMADVLALDTSGNLIIIEIKRDWSNRKTIGQLLEYAAKFKDVSYERLAEEVNKYKKWEEGELYDRFLDFADDKEFPREDIGTRQRIMIVAPDSDIGLKRVIDWLKDYGVPVEFIPFHIYTDKDNKPKLFMIDGVTSSPETPELSVEQEWAGHWIFNTNETNAPGAYKKMFENNVAAIYGYDDGPNMLEGPEEGDKIMAYVNKQGLKALGTIKDSDVKKRKGIFLDEDENQQSGEYHLEVDWKIILPEEKAITSRQSKEMGYNLPLGLTFGKLLQGELAKKIEEEMRERAEKIN